MKNILRPSKSFLAHGFSRRDLVLTLAGLALLGLLAFAGLARSRDLPGRKVCQTNLRELVAGFNSYEADTGRLPAAARLGTATNDDWIYWQTERLLADSTLAKQLTNFSGVLRCPADVQFSFRGYPYSYSMNANLERASTSGIFNRDELILLYEEKEPNDGACGIGGSADGLAARHFRRSQAGYLDGHVESNSESTGKKNSQPR